MNPYRKFRKNSKALSPVVASIILIAVTVAVSVVVAAWMGGLSLGLMNNAEQVTASNPVFTTTTVTLTLRNTGASSVTIATGTIDGAQSQTPTYASGGSLIIGKGLTQNLILTSATAFAPGAQYQISLVTAKGTTVVYTATYNP
jgi:archaeal type IV pilus assembly protein PilA